MEDEGGGEGNSKVEGEGAAALLLLRKQSTGELVTCVSGLHLFVYSSTIFWYLVAGAAVILLYYESQGLCAAVGLDLPGVYQV